MNKVTGINSEYWEWKKNGVVTKLDELELQGEDVISIRYIEKRPALRGLHGNMMSACPVMKGKRN